MLVEAPCENRKGVGISALVCRNYDGTNMSVNDFRLAFVRDFGLHCDLILANDRCSDVDCDRVVSDCWFFAFRRFAT